MRLHEALNGTVDLFPTTRKTLQDLIRNALDFKPDQFTFIAVFLFQIIPKNPAFLGQFVQVNFARIANRPHHFPALQSLVFSIPVARDIDNNIVRMELRIKQSAGVMMVLRVEEIAREFDVVRVRMDARTKAYRGEAFHLLHGQLDRFLVGPFQSRIEERHDRDRLLCRALEVIESDRVPDIPDREFLSVDWIDVLLKR